MPLTEQKKRARTLTIDDTLTEPGQPADAKATGDRLAEKLDIVDLPDTVDNANQLLSEKYVVDTEPYQFRPSGGNGANREFDTIVGGSIVWNQLVDDSDSSITVTSGHKYIAKVDGVYSVAVSDGTAVAVTGGIDEVFDLTTMFGSEIADHIYELEQATTGAGVAWFRKYFPKDYYEYNVGGLMSVSGLQSHNTVGFNLWDEEWAINQNKVQNKNLIPCFPETKYYIHAPSVTEGIYAYDYNGVYICPIAYNKVGEFTTLKRCRYIRFTMKQDYGETYKNDICINLSGTRNGEYEPYTKHSYPLDSNLTLRGIPKLTDGLLSFDGDIYKPDGTVERRYGARAYESGDESLSNAITDGTNTVYKLTTPTTEQAEPYQSPQILDPYGTEEYVTTSLVPVGHETKYPENLRAKIEGLPWNFASLIAPVEAEFKATRNYTSGSLFIVNNTLYKATANIANGGTITPNTNCMTTTLAEIIAAL